MFFVNIVVKLHHTDLGGAGKPPMLVLHGLLGSSRNWLGTGRDLAKHWQVFALDARNHGKSPHAPEMDYNVLAADLLAWMDAHHLAKATLVGHSLGGKTAMLLACRHPGRVERLVVVDIAPKDYSWASHRAEFAAVKIPGASPGAFDETSANPIEPHAIHTQSRFVNQAEASFGVSDP